MAKATKKTSAKRGRGRPKGANRVTLQAGISIETHEKILVAADEEFVTPGVLAGRILDDHFELPPLDEDFEGGDGEEGGEDEGEPKPKSGLAAAREREKAIDIEMKEMKLAKERRETLSVGQVEDFLKKEYTTIRSRLLAIPQAMIGLTPEQLDDLEKNIADAMTDLTMGTADNVRSES